jgi:hypothetical protein
LIVPITLLAVRLLAADEGARWWSYIEYLASDALEGPQYR